MALKHLLDLNKTDRYTADGRDELVKLQKEITEDVTYKTGDISQKTGLQKQPDGSWAPPKHGAKAGKQSKPAEGTLKPSRKPDQKKNPLIKNPDVLGMTANGARKRMEAFGAQFVENKNGKDYFKTTSGDLVEVEYGDNKKVLSSTTYTGGEKPEQVYPSTQGHDMQSYMSKLREEGWENQGWERNAANEARGIYKKGDKTIRVKKNWDGSLGGVSEIKTSTESKPDSRALLSHKDHIDLAKEVKSNTMPGSDWTAEEIAKEWKLGKADAEEVKKEFDKIKESKPAAMPKITERADKYVFNDLDNMSDEDKVFKALNAELDESFGDRDGDPGNVETWANDWLDHAMYEGGIGFKKSHASNEPDAAISGDDVMRIVEENPERWARIIGNAKKFYSGKGTSTNFESDESYPIKLLGGKTVKGSEWTKGRSKRDYPLTGRDSAPRILTGDTRLRLSQVTDKVYQIGEISQKTGLQKTANGWRPPQETKFGKVKQNKEGQWGVQVKQGKGSDFLKHKSEAEAKRALSNYTAGYNTTERSKEDPHSDKARQAKQWRKEDEKAAKARRAEGRAAHAAQFQKEEKPAAKNNLEWNEMPNGRVWTSRTPGGKNLTVTWNREKNGDVWYGRSDSETKYKTKEDAMNAPIGPEKKQLTWSPNASVSEKLNDIIKLGEGSEDRTKRPGGYIGPKVQENYVRKALSKRLGATEESIEDLIDSMDEKAIKNAFNGFMENYSSDAAPRVLTGDTKIRVRK